MIEIFNIFFHLLLILTIFSLQSLLLSKTNILLSKYQFGEKIAFNIVFFCNFILILSFLNFSLIIIIYIYLFFLIFLLFLIIILKKKILFFNYIKNDIINFKFIFFLMLCFIIFIDIAFNLTLEWDSQKFWIYKTINFFNNGTIKSLINMPPGDGYSYPFLGSLLWSFFWKLSFFKEEYFGRLFYAFIYLLSIYNLSQKINLFKFSNIIFFITIVLFSYKYFYFGGDQDILIFSFTSIASCIIFNIYQNKKFSNLDIIFLILTFNCLIWTKNEGIFYATMFFISLLFFFQNFKTRIKLCLGLFIFILFISKVGIYNFYNLDTNFNSCCWGKITINYIFNYISWERIFIITKFLLFGILKNPIYILVIILFFIMPYEKKFLNLNLTVLFFYFLNFSFIYAAYILTNIDLIFMLKTGVDRLLFHSTPLLLLIIINYLNQLKLRFSIK